MNIQTRLFLILLITGLAGVFSLLLIDLPALIAVLPIPSKTEIPPITWGLKFLSLVQPSIILLIAVLGGVKLASKVGLTSPVAEAAARGTGLVSALKPQIVPGVIGGLTGGVAIVSITVLWKRFLPAEVISLVSKFGKIMPLPTRFLYGGITEELLLRWGLMSFFVWAAWRLFQKKQLRPKPAYFVIAILLSSIVFGIGHLPIAFFLFHRPTAALIVFVVVANSLFGLVAGYLYWKNGLESAMIAHMLTHVVLFTGSHLGAYF